MPKVEKRGPINIQDVDDAQDCPGIYVWYARLTVGKADWHSDFAGGNENGKLSLAKALRAHSEKFSQQQIDVSAVANFSTVWTGLLEEDSAARWGGDASETAAFTSHPELITALNKNHTREVLLNVIAEAFPYFYSPLYVGLAIDQTLKQRLKQHKKGYLDLWDVKSRDGALQENPMTQPKNFAERAISLGFGPEDLFCYTLGIAEIPEEKLTQEELRAVITSCEWILNRWTTPILGRR